MQAVRNENASAPVDVDAKAKRNPSEVEFPYGDLDAAIDVAKAVHSVGGQSCGTEQLAGHWKLAPQGGGFRSRYAPARTFGLITIATGRVTLTDLGLRVVDHTQAAAAKVDAFLSVALYKAIYDKYKGYQLPGAQALEAEMAKIGVPEKQTDKARQVFIRAARQAGLFWAGEDRLVKPSLTTQASNAPATQEPQTKPISIEREQPIRNGGGGNGTGGGNYHPFIQGLLETLPQPGTLWTIEGRAAWLQAAAQNFMLIYKGDGKIEVTPKPVVTAS